MALYLFSFCQWLESTEVSVAIRESTWAYPIFETTHVLGLALFLGMIWFLDLRLVSLAFQRTPIAMIASRLLPWAFFGFAIMVVSGTLLFWSSPVQMYENVFFRIKVLLLIAAGLNAFVFHVTVYRRISRHEYSLITPTAARVAGVVSLVLWSLIVTMGRLIAFEWF